LPNSEVIKLAEEPLAELQPEMRAAESRRHTEEADLRDRSSLDEPPGIWTPVLLIAVATVGALLGRFLILGAPDAARFTLADKSALELWAGLIGGLCGYGLAAFVVMINWLLEVRRLFTPRMPWPSVGRWILATLLTLALLSLVTATIPAGSVNGRPVHLFSHQIFGITIAGGVAAIPGLVGFLALRSLARNDSQWEQEARCQILLVVRLLRIGSSGGEDIDSCAHGGHAEEFEVGASGLKPFRQQCVERKDFGLRFVHTGHFHPALFTRCSPDERSPAECSLEKYLRVLLDQAFFLQTALGAIPLVDPVDHSQKRERSGAGTDGLFR
jgi:hypothetical protein